jgi:hypothetical protein
MKNWLDRNKKPIQWSIVALNSAAALMFYFQGEAALAAIWIALAVTFFFNVIDE